MTLYFISGLGADERVFQKLSLPQSWKVHHLAWINPVYKESLSSYGFRLSANVNTSEEFILIGLSFGGIVAVEVSKIVKPKLTILISSAAAKHELPAIARFFAKTKLNTLIPASLLKMSNAITYWLFGACTAEEKQLVKQSIVNTPSHFLKWATGEIINWKNERHPYNLIHIHGTKDHLLPVRNIQADVIVKGGGHLMVYSKADEISRILIECINGYL